MSNSSSSSTTPITTTPSAPTTPTTPSTTPSLPSSRFTPRPSATQWDRCLENGAIKTFYGGVLGGLASLVLFRGGGARIGLTGFTAGLGGGMAWYECKQAYAPQRFHNSLLTPSQNLLKQQDTLCRCGKPGCKCGPSCKCTPVGFSTVQAGVVPTFNVEGGACCSTEKK